MLKILISIKEFKCIHLNEKKNFGINDKIFTQIYLKDTASKLYSKSKSKLNYKKRYLRSFLYYP